MKKLRELIHNANLTKTQKTIAKFILDNSADACFMTSTDIASALGVSESSVIRFSRSLGFGGFMDFQKALRKDYQDKVLSISNTITIPSQRIVKRAKLDSHAEYINRHFKNAAHNLETVFSKNPLSAFEEAADAIIAGKRKYVLATRGNSCLGDYFLLYRQFRIYQPFRPYLQHFQRRLSDHIQLPPLFVCRPACGADGKRGGRVYHRNHR